MPTNQGGISVTQHYTMPFRCSVSDLLSEATRKSRDSVARDDAVLENFYDGRFSPISEPSVSPPLSLCSQFSSVSSAREESPPLTGNAPMLRTWLPLTFDLTQLSRLTSHI